MMSMYQKFDNNNNNHEENVNNVDEFYKMFLSIDDVNDAINEMKANNETNLINLYAKGGKMWIFLQQLSRIDRSNEDYYFHFLFFQKALEINGAIQKFVSNDECLAFFLNFASKTFLNRNPNYDWRHPFMETVNIAIKAMVWMDEQTDNAALHQSTSNMLFFTLKYLDP